MFEEKFFGKYRAYVRDTRDVEQRGRIKCFCPQVMGKEDTPASWLPWAEACLPYAMGGTALDYATPLSKDDAGQEVPVWVEFEAGDPKFPIWSGMAVYAPTTKDRSLTKSSLKEQVGVEGAGLFGLIDDLNALDSGSVVGSMSPPYPAPDQGDRGMTAKAGKRLVFLVEGGGSIIIDNGRIDIVCDIFSLNGKVFLSSSSDIVGT